MLLNRIIDHTFLKPNADRKELETFFEEAIQHDFVCVAVLPNVVAMGHSYLKDTDTHVMAAISYPRGMVPTRLKLKEIEEAIRNGANEIDVVLNIEAIKSREFQLVAEEIADFRKATRDMTAKVIIEAPLLTDEEIAAVCRLASDLEIDFVKTSTGYHGNLATVAAVEVMKRNTYNRTKVKAAGGIKDLETLIMMVRAGAERVGTSSGPAIMEELRKTGADFDTLVKEGQI